MKTLIKTTVVAVALTCGSLFAGSGHSHDGGHGHSHTQVEVTKAAIKDMAPKELMRLVTKGKLDKSWLNIPVTNIKKKQFHHNVEWVVSFKNKEIKDKAKQNVYIFFSLYGKKTGANHTGK